MVSIGVTVEKYQQRNDCYYVAYTLFIYADGKRMTLTNRVLKWNYAYRPCAEIKVNKIPTEMLLSASSFKLDGGVQIHRESTLLKKCNWFWTCQPRSSSRWCTMVMPNCEFHWNKVNEFVYDSLHGHNWTNENRNYKLFIHLWAERFITSGDTCKQTKC